MTTTNKATLILKFLKDAKFESKLFKVLEVEKDHPLLNKFIKEWENVKLIYLKEKYLNTKHTELIAGDYYKFQLSFDKFEKEGKEIVFINKVRFKVAQYTEVNLDSEDDGEDW